MVRLHRIRNEQLYHYYLGDPIEVRMLHDDGTHPFATVGPDVRAGQVVQLRIPGNTFHTAQIRNARQWFLGGSTEWPGVVPAEDVELGNATNSRQNTPTSPLRSAASRCLRVSSLSSCCRRRRHAPISESVRKPDGLVLRAIPLPLNLALRLHAEAACDHLPQQHAIAGRDPKQLSHPPDEI